MFSIGQTAVISMISHLFFIYLTWKLMLTVNLEPLVRKGRAKEAQVLAIFVTIVIGAGVSRFFLEFLQWSRDLIYLF